MIDRKRFFDNIRSSPFGGSMSLAQVEGLSKILTNESARSRGADAGEVRPGPSKGVPDRSAGGRGNGRAGGTAEISNEQGNRLLRMMRRSSGSIVTWRRAQIVLLAAQRLPATRIAEVVFSNPTRCMR